MHAFGRHRTKLMGGLLGGAGAAGGAWAAVSAWASSLGIWGSLGLSLGLLAPPAWIPVAGGLAGLSATGGALAGALSVSRARARRRHLQSIVGLSRFLVGPAGPTAQDERLLRGFLRSRGIAQDRARKLLATTPDEARVAARSLSSDDRCEVARCIFPLVYLAEGVVTNAGRRRFARVCDDLQLPADAARGISRDYRLRLDRQWDYLRRLVGHLNHFAEALVFDLRELETVRDLIERLSRFDPRRRGRKLRLELLDRLGREADGTLDDDSLGEASLVAAYALAHTALGDDAAQRRRLGEAFDDFVGDQAGLTTGERRRLGSSRRRVDRLYRESRAGLGPGAVD